MALSPPMSHIVIFFKVKIKYPYILNLCPYGQNALLERENVKECMKCHLYIGILCGNLTFLKHLLNFGGVTSLFAPKKWHTLCKALSWSGSWDGVCEGELKFEVPRGHRRAWRTLWVVEGGTVQNFAMNQSLRGTFCILCWWCRMVMKKVQPFSGFKLNIQEIMALYSKATSPSIGFTPFLRLHQASFPSSILSTFLM